jgi:hypothetical protein
MSSSSAAFLEIINCITHTLSTNDSPDLAERKLRRSGDHRPSPSAATLLGNPLRLLDCSSVDAEDHYVNWIKGVATGRLGKHRRPGPPRDYEQRWLAPQALSGQQPIAIECPQDTLDCSCLRGTPFLKATHNTPPASHSQSASAQGSLGRAAPREYAPRAGPEAGAAPHSA